MSFWKTVAGFFSSKEAPKVKQSDINLDKEMKKAEVVLDKFKNGSALTLVSKRARNKKGHYKADNKTTLGINEAWVGGKAPKKKKTKKKVKKK